MTTKVNAIIEELKSLTLLEAAELIKEIELTFNVDTSTVSMSSSAMSTSSSDSTLKDVEEQTEFSVVLEEVPPAKKIAILKVVRSLTGLGLKDAKNLVESFPKTVKENLSKNDADDIKQQLEQAGAKIIIK